MKIIFNRSCLSEFFDPPSFPRPCRKASLLPLVMNYSTVLLNGYSLRELTDKYEIIINKRSSLFFLPSGRQVLISDVDSEILVTNVR